MPAPRMRRICSSLASSSSSPAKRTEPSMRELRPRVRPMTVSEVTDLPEPDSPTMARISPSSIVSETSSTALTRPSSVANVTRRSETSSSGGRHALSRIRGSRTA